MMPAATAALWQYPIATPLDNIEDGANYPVATFVSALAGNIRSSLDPILARYEIPTLMLPQAQKVEEREEKEAEEEWMGKDEEFWVVNGELVEADDEEEDGKRAVPRKCLGVVRRKVGKWIKEKKKSRRERVEMKQSQKQRGNTVHPCFMKRGVSPKNGKRRRVFPRRSISERKLCPPPPEAFKKWPLRKEPPIFSSKAVVPQDVSQPSFACYQTHEEPLPLRRVASFPPGKDVVTSGFSRHNSRFASRRRDPSPVVKKEPWMRLANENFPSFLVEGFKNSFPGSEKKTKIPSARTERAKEIKNYHSAKIVLAGEERLKTRFLQFLLPSSNTSNKIHRYHEDNTVFHIWNCNFDAFQSPETIYISLGAKDNDIPSDAAEVIHASIEKTSEGGETINWAPSKIIQLAKQRTVPANVDYVRFTLNQLRDYFKVMHFEKQLVPHFPGINPKALKECLIYLSNNGEILFSPQKQDISSEYFCLDPEWLLSTLTNINLADIYPHRSKDIFENCPILTSTNVFHFLETLLPSHQEYLLQMFLQTKTFVKISKQHYLLPNLLQMNLEEESRWSYKCSDSWRTALCHSWLLPSLPSSPQLTLSAILRQVLSSQCIQIQDISIWSNALHLRLKSNTHPNTSTEFFIVLSRKFEKRCVSSGCMSSPHFKWIICGKGPAGGHGTKLWKNGFNLVTTAMSEVCDGEREVVCPDCLEEKAITASCWSWERASNVKDEGILCGRGHLVSTALITGVENLPIRNVDVEERKMTVSKPVTDLLEGVVLVALWDGKEKRIKSVGSGFVVDKKLGLIVTASHTLMPMESSHNCSFGEDYFGLKNGKALIGVIPQERTELKGKTAVFRYFAEIVAKDACHVDACVLRITTRLERDVEGEGGECGDVAEIPLKNDIKALKAEKLQQLKVTRECEYEEQVRILGYNQGGEGLVQPGLHVNRYIDFAKGYVCKWFKSDFGRTTDVNAQSTVRQHRTFQPREEIVVICPTIGGHSGGPCVNQRGEVIGILSRVDTTDYQRCYIVPTTEWKGLVKEARNACRRSPIDLLQFKSF